ncbi:MFS transporter [Xenorhabdus sp. XENO-1]|uniref:MFS transporter n=1 Tax=Xenorhabdus bovienii TaxID=40576 RepID=UPI0020CA7FC6|nr:MFS transporter [Xenorhabdus bovienii]MCP9267493.1 MFS transporter [Xenorhabdus bovienii subsp. africana]
MNRDFIIFTACVSVFIAQMGISMYLPALPAIVQSLSSQQQDVSLALSAFLIGMAAPMLIWGSLSEKYGRKIILSISLLFFALCSTVIPMAKNSEMFIFLRFLQGVGASGMSVMSRVLIKDNFSGEQLAKSFSWLSISFVVSLGIGQFIGSIIVENLGWQAIFLFQSIFAVLILSLIMIKLPSQKSIILPQEIRFNYIKILQCKNFLLLTLTGGLGYGMVMIFNSNAPFIFQTSLKWSAYEYGLLGWPISLAYFIGAYIVNRYVVQKGRNFFVFIGLGCLLFGCAIMLLGGIFKMAVFLWFPYCIAIAGQAMIYPVSISLAAEKSPISGAYPVALCGFIHQIMAAVIGAIASMLLNQHIWMSTTLMFFLALAALFTVVYSLLEKSDYN